MRLAVSNTPVAKSFKIEYPLLYTIDRLRLSCLLREKAWRDAKEAWRAGESFEMARSRGSARVPVSINVTSGVSQRRMVPGSRSRTAKTPRPL